MIDNTNAFRISVSYVARVSQCGWPVIVTSPEFSSYFVINIQRSEPLHEAIYAFLRGRLLFEKVAVLLL